MKPHKPFRPYIIGPTHLRVHCHIDSGNMDATCVRSGHVDLDIGGAGHNLAQAFARVGATPTLRTVLPQTVAGDIMVSHLQSEGIQSRVERSIDDELPAAVEHWSGGPRSIFTLESNPLENHEFDMDSIKDDLEGNEADLLILSGGLTVKAVGNILELAESLDVPIIFFSTDARHTETFLTWASEARLLCMTGTAWSGVISKGASLKDIARRYSTTAVVISEDLKINVATRFDTSSHISKLITEHPSTVAAQIILEAVGNELEIIDAVERAALGANVSKSASDTKGAFTNAVGNMVSNANHDPLTGLLNRGGMERSLGNGLYAIIVSDLDHFKSVNDNYGHAEGDRVLREAAEVMSNVMRSNDLAVRWGGEEFVLLLPRANLKEGAAIADRIRVELERSVSVGDRKITGSFGVTTVDLRNETIESAVERADQGLYEAKENGRNQVRTVPLFSCIENESDIEKIA